MNLALGLVVAGVVGILDARFGFGALLIVGLIALLG